MPPDAIGIWCGDLVCRLYFYLKVVISVSLAVALISLVAAMFVKYRRGRIPRMYMKLAIAFGILAVLAYVVSQFRYELFGRFVIG